MTAVAEKLSKVTGRIIQYVNVPPERWRCRETWSWFRPLPMYYAGYMKRLLRNSFVLFRYAIRPRVTSAPRSAGGPARGEDQVPSRLPSHDRPD
jgi:hypothetical protein